MEDGKSLKLLAMPTMMSEMKDSLDVANGRWRAMELKTVNLNT